MNVLPERSQVQILLKDSLSAALETHEEPCAVVKPPSFRVPCGSPSSLQNPYILRTPCRSLAVSLAVTMTKHFDVRKKPPETSLALSTERHATRIRPECYRACCILLSRISSIPVITPATGLMLSGEARNLVPGGLPNLGGPPDCHHRQRPQTNHAQHPLKREVGPLGFMGPW